RLALEGDSVVAQHEGLGQYRLHAEGAPQWLFTENETNCERLFGGPSRTPYVKDAFHEYLVHGRQDRVNPAQEGTKAAAHYRLEVPAGGELTVCLRPVAPAESTARPFADFRALFPARRPAAAALHQARRGGV